MRFTGIPVVFGGEEVFFKFPSTDQECFFFFLVDTEGGVSCCYIVQVLVFAFFDRDPFLGFICVCMSGEFFLVIGLRGV